MDPDIVENLKLISSILLKRRVPYSEAMEQTNKDLQYLLDTIIIDELEKKK